MQLRVDREGRDGLWLVRLHVALNRKETNDLFLVGDKLVSWPTEGMRSTNGGSPLERSSMFLSEIVAKPDGLELAYESEPSAERAARVMAFQIESVFAEG